MTLDRAVPLDPRAWLLWGGAATLPLITGRHPMVLAELLVIVAVVRTLCLAPDRTRGWSWLLRIALLAVPIGMVFNVLTVHVGNRVIVHLPDNLVLIGGPLTWNAVAYGALNGFTIVALVAIGTTMAAAIEWSAFMRLLPPGASNLAVAGSVAWAFLPQLARSWRDTRETQAARGHRWRGPRDITPVLTPVLAGGLDRAIATAEALEARGFGVLSPTPPLHGIGSVLTIATLTGGVCGLYLFAVGQGAAALAVLAASTLMAATILVLTRRGRTDLQRPTRYRQGAWTTRDSMVAASALIAIATTAIALTVAPASLRYTPYPDLSVPRAQPLVVLLLATLVVPALVAPTDAEPECAE